VCKKISEFFNVIFTRYKFFKILPIFTDIVGNMDILKRFICRKNNVKKIVKYVIHSSLLEVVIWAKFQVTVRNDDFARYFQFNNSTWNKCL